MVGPNCSAFGNHSGGCATQLRYVIDYFREYDEARTYLKWTCCAARKGNLNLHRHMAGEVDNRENLHSLLGEGQDIVVGSGHITPVQRAAIRSTRD